MKIKINIHSFVDLITNSSTELFVLDTDKSLDVVKDILQNLVDFHNKMYSTNFKFEDIFEEPYIGNADAFLQGFYGKSDIKEGIIISGASDNSIPYWMFDFIKDVFGYKTERFHLG